MNAHLFSRSSKILLSILFVLCLAPLIVTARPLENTTARIEPLLIEQFAAQKEVTYWVVLREKANLRPAYAMQNWEARGRFVYERLKAVALSSQAKLRAKLQSKGVAHQPFWIINAIKVTSDKATLQDMAAQPEVEQIVADGSYQIPEPLPGTPQPSVQSVEWNIDRIHAPQVWSTFDDKGEGIVVANIDSGVQFDHPALVNQYRGNLGGGNFDHNYNWFDPTQLCGSVPCDTANHGTHTMGTMVGDDGGENQIGVAPHARWIAAKGCEYNWCSYEALMAAGQWVLAPTDLNGQNPRADLRPNIVNNSWGGGGNDTFYQDTVQAWIASGIFPAFSNGNAGPWCNTSGSPGDYVESYSAGAFDSDNSIADFSSRGPSGFGGEIKPNIAAPGVNVRSSVPYGYDWYSGTSMASPHVAGTVALMWSAAPSLIGDIVATRALLDQTAINVTDQSCGGTADDNNVWGEGRLDAYAAVEQAPRGPSGTLQGTVVTTDPFLSPLNDATVQVVGPTNRGTYTDVAGQYAFPFLPVGTYDVMVSLFGYLSQIAHGVTVSDDAVTVQDFILPLAPAHVVSGYVRDTNGDPVANATVAIPHTPLLPATTDENGFYRFASVPEGEYDVGVAATGCNDSQTQHLVVGPDDVTLDFTLSLRTDGFGYTCQHAAFDYIEATNRLPLSGDDTAVQVDLPFPFGFYGQTYHTAFVSTNGFLNFLEWNNSLGGSPIPNPSVPNAAVYSFWDDLYVADDSSVNTELIGTAPDRQFVIDWRNVHFCCYSPETLDFEVVLYENGRILMQYRNIDPNGREQGNSATVGIENESGTIALQYSYDEPVISNNLAVRYVPPPSGFLEGDVLDRDTGTPIDGAVVTVLETGSNTTTDATGHYRMLLRTGTYNVSASAFGYFLQDAAVEILQDATTIQDFALPAKPRFTISGQVRDQDGQPIANATVSVLQTPIPPAHTDADGFYSLSNVPQGGYLLEAAAGRCVIGQTQPIDLNDNITVNFDLTVREDNFGYRCKIIPLAWEEANTTLPLSGFGNSTSVSLPFHFSLYGQEYDRAYVSTSGFLNFLGQNYQAYNDYIPSPNLPNAAIYPFWDELYVPGGDGVVKYDVFGTEPNRVWVLEYENVPFDYDYSTRVNFEVKLYEGSGAIEFLYQTMPGMGNGSNATIGIENSDGTDAFAYSYFEPTISNGLAVRFDPPPYGFVEGRVTDAVDGAPLTGVKVTAIEAGRTITTDVNGRYRMLLRVGTYTLEAAAKNYVTEQAQVSIVDRQAITQNFALKSARAQVSPAAMEFIIPAGQTRTSVLTLRNVGQVSLTFTLGELPVTATATITPPKVIDSHTIPQGYTPRAASAVLAGGPTLVLMDAYPWGRDSLLQVLAANGIAYDIATSAQMSTIDLARYDVVFISSDQPQGFYDNYNANVSRLADYVEQGGFLWVGAASWGFNSGNFNGSQLPGGATVRGPVWEFYNNVVDSTHPTMQGVPNPFSGSYASHAAFENLPAGAMVIAQGQDSGLPTLIEYEFGNGRVLAFGQTLEYYWGYGDPGRILENGVPYAYAFEPVRDIPWISESPTSGTLAPGTTQAIQVTVNTTGLTPGLYRARLILRTNDPRNPRLQVPVTLIVPAYQQGVNAGGKAYTDRAGDNWAADKQWATGSWGYINKSTTSSTKKGISGTSDGPLYQDLRSGALEYRFDRLPAGVYQVELRFAEINTTQPGKHMFDVLIEGNMMIYKHDIALEVGSFAADNHTFFVQVTDGQLNVRLIPYRGYGDTIINALRVTQRPDR
jgi:subtilisin family serine protease